MNEKLKCYKLEFCGEFVVAYNEGDASDILEESFEETMMDLGYDGFEWKEIPLDGKIAIEDDDTETGWDMVTIEWWIKEFGRGYVE